MQSSYITFLSDIFNRCLSEGLYPDALKIAEMIPIFKKGDRDKTANYRLISLLSQFNKIYEKLIYARIYSYLIKFNLLHDHQFGFRKNSFTTLAINNLYDDLSTNTDKGLYSCGNF